MMTHTVRSRPVLVTLMALSLVLSPLLGTGALSAAAADSPDDESAAADDADAASSPDEDGADASDQQAQTDQGNASERSGDASGQGAGDDDSNAGSGSDAESEQAAERESSENAEGREDASSQQQDEAADENSKGSDASSGQGADNGESGGESDAASEQGAGDADSNAGSGSDAESEQAAERESSENAEGREDAASQQQDEPPYGNVGSVKVAPVGGAATPPGMEPHIEGCAFDILIHGRGNPDSVTVDIFAQPPTGGAHLRTVTVDLDGDAPPPGNELSGRATVNLESQLREMAESGELEEHDQQGFHLKLHVDTPEGGAKQKVFWLDCAVPEEEDEATPGEPDEEDEQEQDEDVAPEDEQLEGQLTVAKEVTGDAPADPFEFVIECDDNEWTRTVAAGEAGEPVTVLLDAEEESASCTVTEVETHGADEVTVDGEGLTDDPQIAVEVDAGESVETVFVNAFDDEDVAPGEEPPAGGDRPDGEGPVEDTPEDAPAEDTPAEDTPAEDAPAEGGSAEPPAEDEPTEVAPSDEAPESEVPEGEVPESEVPEDAPAEDALDEDAPEEVAAEDAPTDQPLFEAVAPEEAQREQAAPEQTEREHVAAGADVQQVTAADEPRQLAATGLSLPAQLMVALVAIGAGATLLTLTSVRGRAWGTRTGGSLR